MSTDRYLTLEAGSQGLYREKASKFIAYAFPVMDEDTFTVRCAAIAREHHASRHVCYAWVLGENGDHARAHDAGEPSGTAGRPILRQLQAARLTFAAIVVVRYFGGTLLGKGGLVHAYAEAAREALAAARVIEHVVRTPVRVRCGYAHVEALKNDIARCDGITLSADYADRCALRVAIPRAQVERFIERWRIKGVEVEADQPK